MYYRPSSVKLRVNELESSSIGSNFGGTDSPNVCTSSPDRRSTIDPSRNLVLNLTTQFEGAVERASSSAANSPSDDVLLVRPLLAAESPKFSRIAVNKPPPMTAVTVCSQQKREGDPFSSRLDRVFECEERKQCREPIDSSALGNSGCDVSRQNSWSSYDSAVVVRDVMSRNSSWGSCDTRTLPSRNSSWGSYDVRSAMQYVSERGERPAAVAELSVAATKSADEPSYHHPSYHPAKRSKQKEDNLLLPNCYSSSPTLGRGPLPKLADWATASQPNISGLGNSNGNNINKHNSLVKSLKEEFEAKAGDTIDKPVRMNSGGGSTEDDKGSEHVKSLPSSPVSEHPKVTQRPSPAASMEDISVRKLVGKYENGRARSKTFVLDSGCPRKPNQPPVPTKVSSLEATTPKFTKFECNPVVLPIQQSDICASVNRAANNKLQQGKSHPLTKLSFKQNKVNSTVYNSM